MVAALALELCSMRPSHSSALSLPLRLSEKKEKPMCTLSRQFWNSTHIK